MIPTKKGKSKVTCFIEPKKMSYTPLQADLLSDIMMAYLGTVYTTYLDDACDRMLFCIMDQKDLQKLKDFKYLYEALISASLLKIKIDIIEIWL